MSKMSSVYQEVQELGFYTVRQIEEHINVWNRDSIDMFIVDKVLSQYNSVSEDAAIMIVAGAKDYKISNMLKEQENAFYNG